MAAMISGTARQGRHKHLCNDLWVQHGVQADALLAHHLQLARCSEQQRNLEPVGCEQVLQGPAFGLRPLHRRVRAKVHVKRLPLTALPHQDAVSAGGGGPHTEARQWSEGGPTPLTGVALGGAYLGGDEALVLLGAAAGQAVESPPDLLGLGLQPREVEPQLLSELPRLPRQPTRHRTK